MSQTNLNIVVRRLFTSVPQPFSSRAVFTGSRDCFGNGLAGLGGFNMLHGNASSASSGPTQYWA